MNTILNHSFFPFVIPILALLLSIHAIRSIGMAMENYRSLTYIIEQAQRLEQAPRVLDMKKAAVDRMEIQIEKMRGPGVALKSQLDFSTYLSNLCKRHTVRLDAMPYEIEEVLDDYSIASQAVSLQGGLHNMLRLIHTLEQKDRAGTITYANFSAENVRIQGKKQRLLMAHLKIKRLREAQ